MSQQSVLFDSFNHAVPRYGETAIEGIDVLGTKKHATLQSPAYPIKREKTSENTVAFGQEITFKLPNSGYLHHIAIKWQLAQTSSENYSDYPGLSIIDEVEFRSDNETIHQYKYPPVAVYYLNQFDNEEAIDKILLAAGGTNVGTAGNFYCMSPIPTFFDPILDKEASPLNLAKFKKVPEIKLTMRTLANSVKPTSTGGSILSAVIVLYLSETSPSQKLIHLNKLNDFHKGVDFYTNEKNSVATATSTNIDITSCKGLTKKFMVYTRTVSDVDTNKQYYSLNEIDEIKTVLDGHEEWVGKTKEELEFDVLMYTHGRGFNSTIGYPYYVPFGYAFSKGYHGLNTAGLHSSKIGKSEIQVKHSIGANEYIDVLGVRSAIFKYDNGQLIRLL